MNELYKQFQAFAQELVRCGFIDEETDIELKTNSKGVGSVVNLANDHLYSTNTNRVICWETNESGEQLLWDCWASLRKGEIVPFLWL